MYLHRGLPASCRSTRGHRTYLSRRRSRSLFRGGDRHCSIASGVLPRWLSWPRLLLALGSDPVHQLPFLMQFALWVLAVSVLLNRRPRAATRYTDPDRVAKPHAISARWRTCDEAGAPVS
jgi:hypothetical protein